MSISYIASLGALYYAYKSRQEILSIVRKIYPRNIKILDNEIVNDNGGLYIIDTDSVKRLIINGNANVIISNNMYTSKKLEYIEVHGSNNIVLFVKSGYIVIDGEENIAYGNTLAFSYIERDGDTIIVKKAQHTRILYNHISAKTGKGIIMYTDSANNIVHGNIVVNSDIGILCAGCYESEVSHNVAPYGINTAFKSYDGHRIVFHSNRCYGCKNGIIVQGNSQLDFISDNFLQCLRDDCGTGILVDAENNVIVNNIAYYQSGTPCSISENNVNQLNQCISLQQGQQQ